MFRLSHILTTTALVAVSAAPAAATSDFRTSYQPVPASSQGQDLRSPDAVDAAQHRGIYAPKAETSPVGRQDLRSPDAVDAAQHRGIYAPKAETSPTGGQDLRSPDAVDAAQHRGIYERSSDGYTLNRDYGSPDAVDAARELPPVQIPVVEARDVTGFDWGDAGIGAAGMFGIFGIAGACALLLTGRKRRQRVA